jgi:DNA-damage-inducible protein D
MNINFESIKKVDENRDEYWTARDLFPLFGYARWETFSELITRAIRGALNSGQTIENHFRLLTKMVDVGSNTKREIKDWKLDRYACYLIAQNGDPKIKEIALAQTYFAIQTRRQETADQLSNDEKRIYDRDEVRSKNKKLFSTARLAGVSNFGKFNDAGYKGLYTMPLAGIESKKGLKKGELLDRSGSEELGANLFRITQTEAKLKRENIHDDLSAQRTHFDIGKKVRQTIKEIGGEMPENLKPERHIKEVRKELKSKKKGNTKKLN